MLHICVHVCTYCEVMQRTHMMLTNKLTCLPLTHPASVSQQALGVCDQLRVPPVGAGSEAGHLPTSRESQRLCCCLRGGL